MGRVTDSGRMSGARVRVASGQGWQALGLGFCQGAWVMGWSERRKWEVG